MIQDEMRKLYLFLYFGGWITVLILVLARGWEKTWRLLHVSTLSPPFADLRTVQGALKSLEYGLNPQISNPGDPWSRVMNYPRIWVEIARILQLQIEFNYVVFVLTLILLYLTCCFFLLKRYPSPWILVLVFSGSSLFAIERGNSDLLIFSLLYGSAIAPIYAGAFLIFVGTALKIYPFLATIAFMKNKKVLLFLGVFICFCLYLMRDQFSLIKAGTPQSAWQSYGSLSVAGTLSQKLGILFNH